MFFIRVGLFWRLVHLHLDHHRHKTKYYYFGSSRVAMRQGTAVYYLHGDHLGSTSLTTDSAGQKYAESRYLPYGQERWTSGALPTDFGFTGQRVERGFGLMDYNARYYSPVLGRFVSPDTVIPQPGNPQAFNRYSYAVNNPLRYRDPSGHWIETAWDIASVVIGAASLSYNISQGNTTDAWIDAGGLVVDVAAAVIPIVPGGASVAIKAVRGASKVDDVVDVVKATNQIDNVLDTANQLDNAADALKQLDNLPDDEVLYQFSRRPKEGKFQGFPDTLRTKQGETGMSCQIASVCGHDPVQGFTQQMRGQKKPGPGDWVRETTVGDVKQWGGKVDPDYLKNPDLPHGHATIYSSDGKWGNDFKRIWRNERPIIIE